MKTEIGLQSCTYRKFSIETCAEKAGELGLEAIELWPDHLPIDSPPGRCVEFRRKLEAKGLRVAGTGVVEITAERTKTEAALDYANLLGAGYVSISLDPEDRQTIKHLVAGAEKRGLLLGIHNHGPGDRFSEPEAVLSAVRDFPPLLGACVDTGHYLRAGRAPVDAVRILGGRVHSVHLRDFLDEKREVEPGTGGLSFPEFIKALREHTDFHSAFVLEYEADPGNPTPSMQSAVARLREALNLWD